MWYSTNFLSVSLFFVMESSYCNCLVMCTKLFCYFLAKLAYYFVQFYSLLELGLFYKFVYCISVLLVPVCFVPVVIVSAIFDNKVINLSLVYVVTMLTVLAVLKLVSKRLFQSQKPKKRKSGHLQALELQHLFTQYTGGRMQ